MFDRISIVASQLGRRLQREDGQTTVEYAIILALVILLAVGAFAVLDPAVNSFMSQVGSKLTAELP